MTKQEIYDALKKDGAKLPKPAQFYKLELLEEEYAVRFGFPPEKKNDVPENNVVNIRPLKFTESGWCSELSRSYFEGVYKPRSSTEFEILKRYASEVL